MAPERHTPAPLVVHRGAIGDMIRLTVLLRCLAARRGGPCDVVAGAGPWETLYRGLEEVGTIRRLTIRHRPYWASREQRDLVRWLRDRGPGPVYLVEMRRPRIAPWNPRTRLEWLLTKAGVPDDAIVSTRTCVREPLENMVDYLSRMAGRDPGSDVPPAPALAVCEDEIADVRQHLRAHGWSGEPLILLQTGARRNQRGVWPESRWSDLARALLEREPDAWVAAVGAPWERERCERIAAAAGDPRARALAEGLGLRRLFALLRVSRGLISLDTGPAHAAAAVDCPVVVLAGKADPRRNRPVGSGGRVEVVTAIPERDWPATPEAWWSVHDPAAIRVDAVLDAWSRLHERTWVREAAR